ncbi:porphobilinogen synthase [Staphylococcus pseudintermedius]|uniref:Delta-aminolevulinic acid dehydratase n=7 Tax=Staphylococcus pseudintermedius TaxID=283734 RepID=A0A3D8YQB9_STAPS|nr:porphobilinogen synthase [Staphylococcus pseudintermedius]ADV05952.1 Porphobilinogen synthase [Staphylococcus pseudintermedius HKU10-03]ADX76405.1 delta-aminolevulinic acid dehydratase [Staphylococcus pseudintermedius ED99]ANQ81584.1 delta-aminolevulinic acid dehydratase [Staphylococcus pseudintermedius]ANQ88112.1 delta-aminolevulinic acid dehydratase [Staphylococcus pseudintermedius]ANS89341.1 Porphobilinogen synthase [Staphylococcus pseudintermedius]
MQFDRHRRLRSSKVMRDMVRETHVRKEDLIYPIFVVEKDDVKAEIKSLPGVYQISLNLLHEELKAAYDLGIRAIMFFGIPNEKDACGTGAFIEDGIIQKATRLAKSMYNDLLILADTCLCEYTDHGHCGVIDTHTHDVDNDKTLPLLVQTAVSQVKAGADIIAPSNMMDGFVAAIRQGLDEAGYYHIPIMSYGIKYASSFFGPFRDAAESAPSFGDRKTYQMDPANRLEALRELESDLNEGADMMIVKPALSYLDIIRDVRNNSNVPIIAYNVSGEYSMTKAAALNGWIDEEKVVMEQMISMKRAGADMIITYFAKDICQYLDQQ